MVNIDLESAHYRKKVAIRDDESENNNLESREYKAQEAKQRR